MAALIAETATRRSEVIGTLFVIVPVDVALTGALDATSPRSAEAALRARLAPLNLKPTRASLFSPVWLGPAEGIASRNRACNRFQTTWMPS